MTEPRPAVRVLLADLAGVLAGRTVRCSDDSGREVDVRLFGPEEFLAEQHAAVDRMADGDAWLKIDLARARELTQPPLR